MTRGKKRDETLLFSAAFRPITVCVLRTRELSPKKAGNLRKWRRRRSSTQSFAWASSSSTFADFISDSSDVPDGVPDVAVLIWIISALLTRTTTEEPQGLLEKE